MVRVRMTVARADENESGPVTGLSLRLATSALLLVSAAGSALWILYWDKPYPGPVLLLVVLSFVPLCLVAAVRSLRRALEFRFVAALIVLLLGFTVVFAEPGHGADLDVYAMYGRIIVEHGDSPYVHTPNEYPSDPWAKRLVLFKNGRNFYGPLFIGLTAAIATVARDSHQLVRLAYKLGAALAVLFSLIILTRVGAPLAGIVLLGLNPVTVIEVVGQGRMDAYIGLALLAAAVLARRECLHLAALAIAAAVLIKVPAGLALAAFIVWVWRRYGVRKAGAVAASGTVSVGLCYLAAGGLNAVRPLLDASSSFNSVSIWRLISEHPNGLAAVTGDPSIELGQPGSIPTLASFAAIILGGLFVAPRLNDLLPALVLALPLLAYLLTSPYPSSWYVLWVLPLLALRPRSSAALIAVSLGSVLLVRQFYEAAVHYGSGARSLADFTLPVADPLLRSLHSASFLVEVIGIVILAITALRFAQTYRVVPGAGRRSISSV